MATPNIDIVRPAHIRMIRDLTAEGMLDMDLNRLETVCTQVMSQGDQPKWLRDLAHIWFFAAFALRKYRREFADEYQKALQARPIGPELLKQAQSVGDLRTLTQKALEVEPWQIEMEIAGIEAIHFGDLGDASDLRLNPDDDPVVAARANYYRKFVDWLNAYRPTQERAA